MSEVKSMNVITWSSVCLRRMFIPTISKFSGQTTTTGTMTCPNHPILRASIWAMTSQTPSSSAAAITLGSRRRQASC